ncbi:cationic amino acid transporter 4-like [Diadema setosum]|uniref:cationic amino acid transporter 4-like n=1 Tax=Diadema setosum TaxID=31175 RepID=UPI003B3A8150
MACASCWQLFGLLSRKKTLGTAEEMYHTPLRRTLTTLQLVLMGLGAMIGAGLYVLTGVEAKEVTGPAIVISYTLAGLAAMLSALCYVEFACRIPRTGSAYTFTYISLGELWAFLIGWNLILEYSIAGASVASSFIGYLDFLCGNALSNVIINTIMRGKLWTVSFLAPYPNIFAALFVILTTLAIICGAKVSAWVNGLFMVINAVIISIIIILGFQKSDIRNWQDYGGFVPRGPESVIAGAATLFFSYVGFDAIAVANEETVDPRKSIPRATFISVVIATVVYVLCSAVLTLMVPYPELDESSAFANAFVVTGVEWAEWAVGVGALCAMFTSVLMSMYCLPRSIYAMATDGLLFSCLGEVNESTGVPVVATLFAMTLVVVLTLFFSLSELVEFLSIGVLLGYMFVSVAVIILRYQPDSLLVEESVALEMHPSQDHPSASTDRGTTPTQSSRSKDEERLLGDPYLGVPGTLREEFRGLPVLKELTRFRPGLVVNTCLGISFVFFLCVVAILEFGLQQLLDAEWWAVSLLVITLSGGLLSFLVIPFHKQNEASGNCYRVDFVPLLPGLSILCNMMLVLQLKPVTWLRFLIWVVIGLLIYAFYGFRHSKEGLRGEQERVQHEDGHQDQPSPSYGSIEESNRDKSLATTQGSDL